MHSSVLLAQSEFASPQREPAQILKFTEEEIQKFNLVEEGVATFSCSTGSTEKEHLLHFKNFSPWLLTEQLNDTKGVFSSLPWVLEEDYKLCQSCRANDTPEKNVFFLNHLEITYDSLRLLVWGPQFGNT